MKSLTQNPACKADGTQYNDAMAPVLSLGVTNTSEKVVTSDKRHN